MTSSTLILKEATTRENRVWVRIAAACNEKCLFCLDADAQNGKLIDDDIIREKIRTGFKVGEYNRIIISGWEASIHPKFPEYIKFAKTIGYDRVQTVTNWNMFAKKEFCDMVVTAGIGEVTFSFHGHRANLHDYLTATPWSFQKALRWLVYLKKYHPQIIINIDIVVCRVNVDFLPDIVRFFMWLGLMEYDILQIIPFGRGFSEYKDQLFYKVEEKLEPLHQTWKLSKISGMNMWTNRFPVEAFEGYEDLIQDPRKIKSETTWEMYEMFDNFIRSHGEKKLDCFGEACDVCFLKQYCHDFIDHQNTKLPENGKKYILTWSDIIPADKKYLVLRWEEFPSQVYEKYGSTAEEFIEKIKHLPLAQDQFLVNVPRCVRSSNNEGFYEWESDLEGEKSVTKYTKKYITDLYRKKSTRCISCKYNKNCEWIHINFIRSYGYKILQPIPNL